MRLLHKWHDDKHHSAHAEDHDHAAPLTIPGASPIVGHDAQGVELALGKPPTANLGTDDQESDAAAAFEGFVKGTVEGKAASWFEWQPEDLVKTPGGIQTTLSIWVFFL